jgi:hypothetical protein
MMVLTCVAMKTCTYCGKEHPDEATECVVDKQPLSPVGWQPASSNKLRLPSIFSAKRSCKILCGMVFAATFSFFVVSYIGARLGMPLSIGILPAYIVPVLIILFSTMALFVICVVTLVQGRNRRLAFSMLVLSLLFLAAGFFIAPANIFQIGFRHRIKSTISPAELREIARVCSNALPLDGCLPGPKKWSLWNETEHRATWNALASSTSLGKLDSSMVIFNHANEVEIAWGGTLVGHWGVIIQKTGSGSGDIAPDIRTFVGY